MHALARPLQFSLRAALIAIFVIALISWPASRWLRTYLANRGLVPVMGRVTFKGQPLANAKVVLVPRAPGKKPAQGVTDAAGFYRTETLVKPGEYTVGITELGVGGGRVPSKYADGSMSGLTVSINDNGENHLAFDLRD